MIHKSIPLSRTKLLFFSLFILTLSCNVDQDRKFTIEDIDYTTSESSEIFFKNVRQSDYDKVEMREAGMDVFRMTDRNTDPSYPNIHLAIAFNWRLDKAFVMVEPNAYFSDPKTIEIIARDPNGDQPSEIIYRQGNLQAQAAFVVSLYNAIQDSKNLFLKTENGLEPIFDNVEDREIFRKTVLDYYRLIDIVN